ncbi:expressed unknown protein [Seminavis robusta]|uniref:Uncharacterized protein n=1 Tax=Seminavis robusta TaxID=568900 RepID=A0A9N8EX79_9STRA|nr:expressed unknown protein [Seminavis robusta]|eukprot:Sro2026_g311670.1 n/a (240) ;mRNA; f:3018-3737
MQHNTAIQEAWSEPAQSQQDESNISPALLMQQRIVQAASLNQQGASCLIAGSIEEASKLFAGALQLVHFELPVCPHKDFPVPTISPYTDRTRQVDDSRGFVYSKPLFFNPQAIITDEDILSYVAVIAFNLGLSYQLEGHAHGDGGKFLEISKSLYQITLNLLNQQLRYDCSNVIIASLNNLACANAELNMFEEAHQMLLLMAVMIKEERVRTDTIHADDFSDVVLNIRLLTMPAHAAKA